MFIMDIDIPILIEHLIVIEEEEREAQLKADVIRSFYRGIVLGEKGIQNSWLKRHMRIAVAPELLFMSRHLPKCKVDRNGNVFRDRTHCIFTWVPCFVSLCQD